MKQLFFYALMIPFFTGMISCSTSKSVDIQSLNGKWTIVEVEGNKVSGEKMPFIVFNMADLKVNGNGGCNMFHTSIIPNEKDKSAFTMKPAAATMMACPNMNMESSIFKTFELISGVKAGAAENEIQLVDANGKVLLTLLKN
ncbi:heat shock protein HslJ [Parabacteroides sp. PF5-5]|uniref:META domain-containing protein n=1 Tax=unclassified Parabacteroides TaxID=2649774 RepID=UPI002477213F|nr:MULTISPECIES: META domain-containing protein [unclassified Parabacteroides]MDH6305059.1 heat shock protein HslJ [Parabacteroides sp. PH5-39]MDH6315856.1 heat shock protein HslJ [Parabacteroides sp. PF5-13]MDH6319513.1 heat shock protein HslJ [Parabacteroides sp. PH5-13]MDH6323244.1 heat shock protein HslJ [Parabacteroides sp. PH5-8]MDH6327248.1 heat shock protein HslJ [Parabacteroides sp. PH5-41]